MKLLLDTHLLLWATVDSPRLSAVAKRLITSPANELIFSAASIWEIAIKHSIGAGKFEAAPGLVREALLESGYSELAVSGNHAIATDYLAPINKDPFDRLLIAQAMVEGLTLLTSDAMVARYPGPIRKV
jgi:PIN domain nuclease of toxin-antitoxin system